MSQAARFRKMREELKRRAIEYKGGRCCICGYDRCMAALQFHHVDRTTKVAEIGKMHRDRKPWEEVKAELDKCVLLCANCHAEVEVGQVSL